MGDTLKQAWQAKVHRLNEEDRWLSRKKCLPPILHYTLADKCIKSKAEEKSRYSLTLEKTKMYTR